VTFFTTRMKLFVEWKCGSYPSCV